MNNESSDPAGGPAFPTPLSTVENGMTLRDYFAGKVLDASVNKIGTIMTRAQGEEVAKFSYQMADMMLAERSKINS